MPLTLDTARSATRRRLAVGGLLLLAAALRVAAISYEEISYDDATVGLVAKHFLSGEGFPVFFYRQPYMGSLNGLHLVPALFLFGPAALVVTLNAVAYSLLFPWLLYLLGRRLFDETTARVALLLAALPPYLLTKWSTVAEPHFETNLFGLVLLLLAVAALGSDPGGARYVRLLACFGLTAGLAWWTNFKAVELIAPALLALWLRDPRLPLRPAAAGLATGFLAGSLPVWIFYSATGGEAAVRARPLFEVGPPLSLERLGGLFRIVLPTLLGTYYWTPDAPPRQIALGVNVALYLLGSATVLAGLVRRHQRGGAAEARDWGLWLLLLALAAPFAMVYASGFAWRFDLETSRYVLPAYIPLFLFVAALVARAAARSRVLAAALLAFLLAFNLWTNLPYLWPLDPGERARRAAIIATREAIVAHLAAHPAEALYVDDQFVSLQWAFGLSGIPVSELTDEIYVPSAVAADAADRVAILARRDAARLTDHFALLGATYRATRFGGWVWLDDIRVPERAYRLIPRDGWRVRGDAAVPPAVADGDLATGWPPEDRPPAGELVVDLGASYSVGRVVWWPSTPWEETLPLAVALSRDGAAWEPIGKLPGRRPAFVAGGRPFFRPRDGWLEIRPTPRPARFLRFAPAVSAPDRAWQVAELYVYEDAGALAEPRPAPPGLAARLRERGVTRLLADPAVSAGVARATGGAIRTPVANGILDSHWWRTVDVRLADRVRLRAADALLVPEEDADDLRARLAREGVAFREEPVGRHHLVYALAPVVPQARCRRTSWRVTAVQRNEGGAWHAIEARLREPQRVVGVRLEHPPASVRLVPPLRVAVSEDGRQWQPVADARRVPEWGWAGRTLFRFSGSAEELWLPPTPATHVRVEVWLPTPEAGAIRSLCVRGEPLR